MLPSSRAQLFLSNSIQKSDLEPAYAHKFSVVKEISRGTMSTVHYCEGGIALKSMGDADTSSSNDQNAAIAIYKNDLTVLTSLGQHPNIVRLFATMQEATLTHVGSRKVETAHNCQVLEALTGGELSYHIVRHGPFTPETARGLFK